MTFQTIKTALVTLMGTTLGTSANVIGYQRERIDSDVVTTKPQVTVFYSGGSFPKGNTTTRGPQKHSISFRVGMLASAGTGVDLTVLQNPTATQGQIAAAIAARTDAEASCDADLDTLWASIWNCLRLPANSDLGLATGTVADVWLDNFQKHDPIPIGETVLMAAQAEFTCTCIETPTTVVGTPGTSGIATTFKLTRDVQATDPTTATFDSATSGAEVIP